MTDITKFGLLLLLLQFSYGKKTKAAFFQHNKENFIGIANDHGTLNNLRKKLLTNYNTNRRPVFNRSTITYLSASMTILHIEKLVIFFKKMAKMRIIQNILQFLIDFRMKKNKP